MIGRNAKPSIVAYAPLPATATEVADKSGVSNQKASAYLKKLVEAERVVKTLDKKKSFFSVNVD